MLEAIITLLPVLITVLVGIVPAALLVMKKASAITKEIGELFVAVSLALEDGKLTGDELRSIIKEGGDVIGIIRQKTIDRS